MKALASDLVIAPANSEGSGCDLTVAGFNSKELFTNFFEQLKTAALKKDKATLSELILYPMRINGTKLKMIRKPSEFSKNFDSLFTAKIQTVIEKQQLDQLFCRDQGVMYGHGEIWVGTSKGKIGIKTLNSP